MHIKTTRRLMVGRAIINKGEEVMVTPKDGKALIDKGHAVEVAASHVEVIKAEAPKTKAAAKNDTKDKAD
jgi:hypothetical protein